jgi:hypothetical protein
MRWLLGAGLALSLVIASAHDALAAPIAVTLNASPASYNGPCPVTVKFTGNISGKRFSSISYVFAHTLGKTTTKTAPVSAIIPKSGILPPVYDALIIDAAHAGAQTNELDVTPGTSKASVAFTVACKTLAPAQISTSVFTTPTPKPSPQLVQLAFNSIPPPKLHQATDPGDCAAHFGPDIGFVALLCAGAIKAGLMLVWEWSPENNCPTCPQTLDGYNIYRVDGGRHQKLWSQTPQDNKGWGPPLPSDGWNGKCYQVSAYKGTQESFFSNRICVGGNTVIGTRTVTLTPQRVRTAHHLTIHQSGVCNSTDTTLSFSNQLEVGYDYSIFTAFCDKHISNNYRGAVLFDLSSLSGKKVFKATLHLGQTFTDYEGSPNSTASYQFVDSPHIFHATSWSCGNVMGTGIGAWWSTPGWFGMSDFNSWTGSSTPLDIDVTTKVGSWLAGTPNYGFVMRSSIEGDLNDFKYLWACTTTVNQPMLTVEYFP